MNSIKQVLWAAGLSAITGVASAAPCAQFTDVDSTSTFCPNVEWIRNRGVTLGCEAGLYCPNASVSRLAMAAFMNRLGTALTPQQLVVDAAPGVIDLDANPVVCQTSATQIADFPRQAFLDLAFAGRATAQIDIAADLVMSTDGGATWTDLTIVANRGSVAANSWGHVANLATVDLDVGQTARFGVRMQRVAGSVDLADSRCKLRVLLLSRDGAAPPF